MSWLYISGRGHSGTTILDIVLGNASQIESYGEVISGVDRLEGKCACNHTMTDCEVWSKVMGEFQKKEGSWLLAVRYLKSHSHIKYWLQLFFLNKYKNDHRELARINQSLHDSLSVPSKKWVLDSSKEPTRAFFLLGSDKDTKVIHMVRDPLGVTTSYKKRFVNSGYFYFLRKKYYNHRYFFVFAGIVGLSWTIGNIMNELMRLRYKKRILRVKHEDLTNDFEKTIREIGRFVDADLTEIIKKKNNGFKPFHNIAGNHLRHQKLIFLTTRSNDKIKLSWTERFLVHITTFPLRWFYGY